MGNLADYRNKVAIMQMTPQGTKARRKADRAAKLVTEIVDPNYDAD
jgi:hypothetical protein